MISFFKTLRKHYLKIATILVFLASLSLGIHNATLYQPKHGFDGSGHIEYVDYIARLHKLPPPTAWETHQPPLYYFIAAFVDNIFGSLKSVQFINIVIFWMIISAVYFGLSKIFKNKYQVILGTFALVSLPMLNIFFPTITNEFLSTFFILAALVSTLSIYYAKSDRAFNKAFIALLACLVLGVWTKISIVAMLPAILFALFLFIKDKRKAFVCIAISITVFGVAYIPIYLRASGTKSPSDITQTASKITNKLPLDFFIRLDWIPKVDMYNTQYYSLLGGAWNSFWTDGHNVITPFVPFHKKSFILWSLGFILLPLSTYGLFKHFKENFKVSMMMTAVGVTMLGFYVVYNIVSSHYSAARLTYQMGIVLPYAFGIASAAKTKKLSILITILLCVQFATIISFFWIQPWWFQAT